MRFSIIIPTAVFAVSSVLGEGPITGDGNATVITNNPVDKQATATLPDTAFFKAGSLNGNVKGFITVKSSSNGIGVNYTVKFANLPKEGGPFIYHIHDEKVPDNGNCTSTKAHLDPTVRGETPACDSNFPQTCQVGDLSGKYGSITSDPFVANFHDEFSSMNAGASSSILDRSFVLHFSNKTRISCANFVLVSDHKPTPGTSPNATAPAPAPPTSTGTTVPVVTAAANVLKQEMVAIAPIAALFLMH